MNKYNKILKDLLTYSNETEWVEFKENFITPNEIGEYISALSNSAAIWDREYAYLIWGINDKTKEVVGTKFNHRTTVEKSSEVLEHYLARNLNPSINFKFIEINYNDNKVLMLEIPRSFRIPTSFKNERYIMIDSSKVNIRRYPEREIYLFDSLREEETITTKESSYQKLMFNKLFVFYASKGIVLNKETFEDNLNLRTPNGKYNILAQLLSDDSKITFRVAIFNGISKVDRMSGIEDFGKTCLLYSLNDILLYGNIINKTQSSDDGRMPRVDTPYFDHSVYSEAVINAFVHNDWLYEDAPQLNVYNDRVEIVSHGGLPRNQTKENFFKGISRPRNKSLAEIFLQLRINEKTGRGVPRIVNAYGKDVFDFTSNSLTVTIPFNIIDKDLKVVSPKVNVEELNLSKREQDIIEMIIDNPNITGLELSKKYKVSTTTIESDMRNLREKNLIERIGSKKSGFWKVIK